MRLYEVIKAFENGVVEMKTIDGHELLFLVNGHRLKAYFQPLTKEVFMQQVQQHLELRMVGGDSNLL